MVQVYVSLGSNIERDTHLTSVINTLRKLFGECDCSSVYESAAVGFEGPAFYNAVIGFHTSLSVEDLLSLLRRVEVEYGRPVNATSFTSRTIDIDLLLYNNLTFFNHAIELPHSDIVKYPFVLKPLAEIAGKERHPLLGKTYTELWEIYDKSFIEISVVPLKL